LITNFGKLSSKIQMIIEELQEEEEEEEEEV